MFRKIALAVAAVAVIGAGALASTDASARGGHGGGHGGGRGGGGHGFHGGGHHGGFHGGGFRHGGWRGGGFRHGGPRFFIGGPAYYGYGGCYVRRVVRTPWGPRVRLINRCY